MRKLLPAALTGLALASALAALPVQAASPPPDLRLTGDRHGGHHGGGHRGRGYGHGSHGHGHVYSRGYYGGGYYGRGYGGPGYYGGRYAYVGPRYATPYYAPRGYYAPYGGAYGYSGYGAPYYGYDHHHDDGDELAAALLGGVLGFALGAATAPHAQGYGYGYTDRAAWCAQQYGSYDPATGTWIDADGYRHECR